MSCYCSEPRSMQNNEIAFAYTRRLETENHLQLWTPPGDIYLKRRMGEFSIYTCLYYTRMAVRSGFVFDQKRFKPLIPDYEFAVTVFCAPLEANHSFVLRNMETGICARTRVSMYVHVCAFYLQRCRRVCEMNRAPFHLQSRVAFQIASLCKRKSPFFFPLFLDLYCFWLCSKCWSHFRSRQPVIPAIQYSAWIYGRGRPWCIRAPCVALPAWLYSRVCVWKRKRCM